MDVSSRLFRYELNRKMKKITTSAPGKLLLFGDHAVVHGHPCIVTAIDQRVFVTVEKRSDDLFVMQASDVEITHYQKKLHEVGQGNLPKSVRFIETVLAEFLQQYPQQEGVSVSTRSDFSALYGFGSSSAVSVAFAQALSKVFLVSLTKRQLFDIVYKAVIAVQGVGSGFDIAAAIWGGTLYYISPAKVVDQLRLAELPLVVGYTGMKTDTPTIINQVAAAKEKDPARIERLFQQSTTIVEKAKTALQKQDWKAVGHLMNQNQLVLAELGVSSPVLYTLISAAKNVGAYGAKLSGAGIGDCMIAMSDTSQIAKIEKAIKDAGGQPISVITNAEGVRIEKEEN